jgi:hypothetical protein
MGADQALHSVSVEVQKILEPLNCCPGNMETDVFSLQTSDTSVDTENPITTIVSPGITSTVVAA